jgi:hypothetical protein
LYFLDTILDDTTDADSDVCIKIQRKRKIIPDSESHDNDSEINPNATASENPGKTLSPPQTFLI